MDWITIGSATDIGCVKAENQDYHTWYPQDGDKDVRSGTLLILADGMGGHTDGAKASQLAANTLLDVYLGPTSDPIVTTLKRGFIEANRIIFEKSAEMLTAKGMGTTLVAAYLKGAELQFAHVGDSRGYLINSAGITQFTEDHSYVASLVKAGIIAPEEAEGHPESNVITRAIGLQETVTVDISQKPLATKKGNYVLLCCDGLWGVVPDEEILACVRQIGDPAAISENLVQQAIDNGGPDNITVLTARINKTGWISGLF
ncbi:MAG: Stp1/IreP family PP2C-type Ser/Thr phosphatase [Desulfobacterales bacterium]|nr:Stp1/IreP family PP2C-type Ser/Thr phosphatase [Desulfobacterales bacterium]